MTPTPAMLTSLPCPPSLPCPSLTFTLLTPLEGPPKTWLTAEGVVQVAYEVIPVVVRQTHEGSTHENVLHLIHHMAQLKQLVDTATGLVG